MESLQDLRSSFVDLVKGFFLARKVSRKLEGVDSKPYRKVQGNITNLVGLEIILRPVRFLV
jgi:hypothetical protein